MADPTRPTNPQTDPYRDPSVAPDAAASDPTASSGTGAPGRAGAGFGGTSGAGDPYGGASQGSSYGNSSYGGSSYGGGGSRLFDDLARFVTDAAGATQGVRREVEQVMRAQGEAVLGRMDVVRRDEHEVVAEMAARARAENETLRGTLEALEARIAMLEARLGGGGSGAA